MGGYEVLEHTADVGLRAWGASVEEVFEQATRGLAELAGVWQPGKGEKVEIAIEPSDAAGLLVDWLSEVLYVQDAKRVAIKGVAVAEVDEESGARGSLSIAPLDKPGPGIQIKAVTYHQLRVEQTRRGWEAEVYLDV